MFNVGLTQASSNYKRISKSTSPIVQVSYDYLDCYVAKFSMST